MAENTRLVDDIAVFQQLQRQAQLARMQTAIQLAHTNLTEADLCRMEAAPPLSVATGQRHQTQGPEDSQPHLPPDEV